MGNGLPCTGGCGCFTDRMIEGIEPGSQVAFCVWCEDGVTCPQGKQPSVAPARPAPAKPKFDAAFVDRRLEEHQATQDRLEEHQATQDTPPAKNTREVMAENKCAGFEGEACDVTLRDTNVTGRCPRHYARWYYRKTHPKKGAAKARKAVKVAVASAAPEVAAGGGVIEQFANIELQVNGMFASLSLDVKVRLLREHLGR